MSQSIQRELLFFSENTFLRIIPDIMEYVIINNTYISTILNAILSIFFTLNLSKRNINTGINIARISI